MIADLEKEPEQLTPVEFDFEHGGKSYTGTGVPILTSCSNGICGRFDVTLNKEHIGILRHDADKWKISEIKSQDLINAIGGQVSDWYQGA